MCQVGRFPFYPTQLSEAGLKLIGCYVLGMHNKVLIITPSCDLNIAVYSDEDFAGLYNYEEHNTPVCVQSRIDFVINFPGCPMLQKSHFQTETATRTLQAEVIACVACC